MTPKVRLIVALAAGFVVNKLLFPPLPFTMAVMAWLIYSVLIWLLIGFFAAAAEQDKANMPADFQATVRHRNIALDTTAGRLWVRPTKGPARVMTREDIKGWKHEWIESSNAFRVNRLQNVISFRTADVHTPVFKVAFGRDYKSAEEWQARLSTWING